MQLQPALLYGACKSCAHRYYVAPHDVRQLIQVRRRVRKAVGDAPRRIDEDAAAIAIKTKCRVFRETILCAIADNQQRLNRKALAHASRCSGVRASHHGTNSRDAALSDQG